MQRLGIVVVTAIGLGIATAASSQPAAPAQCTTNCGTAPLAVKGAQTVDAEGVVDLVLKHDDLVILDNRNVADFESGHIEGAVRLLDTDMTAPEVLSRHVREKAQPLLFYCNGLNCGRAAKAAGKALEWGYSKVHYYAKGMDEWKALGLPMDR